MRQTRVRSQLCQMRTKIRETTCTESRTRTMADLVAPDRATFPSIRNFEEMTLEEHMALYTDQGLSRKDAMKKVAADRGVSKRDIYRELMDQ